MTLRTKSHSDSTNIGTGLGGTGRFAESEPRPIQCMMSVKMLCSVTSAACRMTVGAAVAIAVVDAPAAVTAAVERRAIGAMLVVLVVAELCGWARPPPVDCPDTRGVAVLSTAAELVVVGVPGGVFCECPEPPVPVSGTSMVG